MAADSSIEPESFEEALAAATRPSMTAMDPRGCTTVKTTPADIRQASPTQMRRQHCPAPVGRAVCSSLSSRRPAASRLAYGAVSLCLSLRPFPRFGIAGGRCATTSSRACTISSSCSCGPPWPLAGRALLRCGRTFLETERAPSRPVGLEPSASSTEETSIPSLPSWFCFANLSTHPSMLNQYQVVRGSSRQYQKKTQSSQAARV